jgi:hypothetical protein
VGKRTGRPRSLPGQSPNDLVTFLRGFEERMSMLETVEDLSEADVAHLLAEAEAAAHG